MNQMGSRTIIVSGLESVNAQHLTISIVATRRAGSMRAGRTPALRAGLQLGRMPALTASAETFFHF